LQLLVNNNTGNADNCVIGNTFSVKKLAEHLFLFYYKVTLNMMTIENLSINLVTNLCSQRWWRIIINYLC